MDLLYENCILTIGKFEGIHLGHQALINDVVNRAKLKGLASVAAVFEPHPFKFLRDPSYKPIFTESERTHLITGLGVDHVVTLIFNSGVAAMTPSEYCPKFFCKLRAHEIVVGEEYRFGNNREGTIETLREIASDYGAKVHAFPPKVKNSDNKIISTSHIRALLTEGKLQEAEQLLGFPFFIMGKVTKGRQLGRVLGFPTLNIYPSDEKYLLENGVYETRTIINSVPMIGLTNIGLRPTVSDETKISVETHIPSLKAKPDEMYGQQIKVEFLRFMRPERRFETVKELQSQIQKDLDNLVNGG